MNKTKLKLLRIFTSLILLCFIITASTPITVKADWSDDLSIALQASTAISQIFTNDPINHFGAANVTSYDEITTKEVKEMADAGFKLWALKNLKVPSEAIINSVQVIPFTYELAYEDMNPYYAIIVNYIYTYSGLTLEEFADYKYFVVIDYSGMNELGGYSRNTVCGLVGSEHSDLTTSTNAYSMYTFLRYQLFAYSNQPQTTIIY